MKVSFESYLKTNLEEEEKNPAYGRQRISRPMRIVAPILFVFPPPPKGRFFENTGKYVDMLDFLSMFFCVKS